MSVIYIQTEQYQLPANVSMLADLVRIVPIVRTQNLRLRLTTQKGVRFTFYQKS